MSVAAYNAPVGRAGERGTAVEVVMKGQTGLWLGVLAGLGLLAAGILMIAAKEALWAGTTQLYMLIGVSAERTRLWDMFTTTIGLGLLLLGLWATAAAWSRRARD